MGWAQARADELLVLQNRPGHDGNIYQSGDWITPIRDEDEDIFRSNRQAWMQWWMMQNNLYLADQRSLGSAAGAGAGHACIARYGNARSSAYRWRKW